jgi:mannitol-specific phosphotransferase system IIBC component
MNHEAVKLEDRASQQDHLIAAMEQNQVLDTAQTLLSDQLVTIAASAPIVRLAISQVILSADQETYLETLEKLTSHVQTRESMTATVTRTAKTESQETSPATRLLLALATRTQTAKHSLRTRF